MILEKGKAPQAPLFITFNLSQIKPKLLCFSFSTSLLWLKYVVDLNIKLSTLWEDLVVSGLSLVMVVEKWVSKWRCNRPSWYHYNWVLQSLARSHTTRVWQLCEHKWSPVFSASSGSPNTEHHHDGWQHNATTDHGVTQQHTNLARKYEPKSTATQPW